MDNADPTGVGAPGSIVERTFRRNTPGRRILAAARGAAAARPLWLVPVLVCCAVFWEALAGRHVLASGDGLVVKEIA